MEKLKRNQMTPADRLSLLLAKTEKVGECLKWTGYAVPGRGSAFGYGQTSYNSHQWLAHRLSFYLATGQHPGEMQVMHLCDFSLCVNPAHLALGTQSDNIQDAKRKGLLGHQKKTHCPAGHEYSKENTYMSKGSRHCRACINRRGREARLKKKIAREALKP